MKSVGAALSTVFLLFGCNGGITLPSPVTPALQAVNLHGGPACPATNGTCTLPTTGPTSWALFPDIITNGAGDEVWNRRAIIVVDVPALTDLDLSYTANSKTHAMQEVPTTYPSDPVRYGTDHTDNGETRRWFFHVAVSLCDNPETIHIVDVGRQPGSPRSAPLDVTLSLAPGGGCGGSGGPPPTFTSGSSPSTSSNHPVSGCAAGETLFKICEKCQASSGATPIYHYYEACYTSWQTAQTVHGTGGCPITQVSGPSQCKLPSP